MKNMTALYLRLSRDDEKESESESIANQREFLLDYAKNNELNVVEIFIDDGYSGTSFDRPDFNRMIEMVEKKKINTIITKDLSRLGRDYIKTGYYLEEYFPLHDIRYIAVNDGIDTFAKGGGNDMSPFRAVFNDMYAKDISKKVRTALDTKKRSGKFIGNSAPYGYKKDPFDKNHLVIDEDAAYYVRRIYSEFLLGESIIGIAHMLSMGKVPTPSEYKGLTATQKQFKGVWNDGIIRRILTNPTYAGNLTQNMSYKTNYKIKNKKRLPKEKWITVCGTHEGIVSQEDFDEVQEMLAKRSYRKTNRSGEGHLLTGLVHCLDCGGSMSFVKDSPTRTYLVCSSWRRNAKLGICTSHSIRESYVEEVIKEKLKEIVSAVSMPEILQEADNFCLQESNNDKLITSLEKKLDTCKATQLSLYKDKVSGMISEEDYVEMAERIKAERKTYEERLAELQIEQSEKADGERIGEILKSIFDVDNIDRSTLLMLVDKVYIGKDKEIEIVFKFDKPLR